MELDTVNKFIERHRKLSTKMGSDMIIIAYNYNRLNNA